MHNVFLSELFDWKEPKTSQKVNFVNKVLERLGFGSRLSPPRFTGVMTNVEQRINMFHLVRQVLVFNVPGDLVELGCHKGQSAVLFKKMLDHYDPRRELHVYDSFEGLPDLKPEDGDTNYEKGGMKTTKELLRASFEENNLELPHIHQGWFEDTLPTKLPEKIAFAHLDGDFYDSILVSLQHVYDKLSKNGVCLIDDYADPEIYDGWNKLPGVKVACDEFLKDKPEEVSVLYAGDYAHGYFRKLS